MESRWMTGIVGAAMLALTACGDSGPTAPNEPTNPLLGEWHGTLSYAGGECGGEEVEVTARWEGDWVLVDVPSSCYGPLVLRLTTFNHAVRGNATIELASCSTQIGRVSNQVLTANLSGTIDQERLRIETFRFISTTISVLCSRPPATLELVR